MIMEYRKLPHGHEMISVIGLGTAAIGLSGEEEMIKTVQYAMDHGVNYFDMGAGYGNTFEAFGKAIQGQRDKVYLQIHFGANYETGEYGWTTDLNKIKEQVAWMLKKLNTDYIDFGMIHCLDEDNDLQLAIDHGIIDYIKALKAKGVIKHIGLSSHTPATVHKVLDMNIIDVLMFSINPAYDNQHGDYAFGQSDERELLYRRLQKEGVAITVMKPYSSGQLLDASKSPFHYALTETQCIQYALDKPGVITVLPGTANLVEMKKTLHYLDASDEEKDYSIIASFDEVNHLGTCVYCKHCHPCPAGLDIALINKYYDLAKQGDLLAIDHYKNLEKKASDCIQCGHCNSRCPFHVNQVQRMKEIADYFQML